MSPIFESEERTHDINLKVAVHSHKISIILRFDLKKIQNGGLKMSRYYKYNPNGNKPKYVELTEKEYRKAKQEYNRWFIEFDKECAVECE